MRLRQRWSWQGLYLPRARHSTLALSTSPNLESRQLYWSICLGIRGTIKQNIGTSLANNSNSRTAQHLATIFLELLPLTLTIWSRRGEILSASTIYRGCDIIKSSRWSSFLWLDLFPWPWKPHLKGLLHEVLNLINMSFVISRSLLPLCWQTMMLR